MSDAVHALPISTTDERWNAIVRDLGVWFSEPTNMRFIVAIGNGEAVRRAFADGVRTALPDSLELRPFVVGTGNVNPLIDYQRGIDRGQYVTFAFGFERLAPDVRRRALDALNRNRGLLSRGNLKFVLWLEPTLVGEAATYASDLLDWRTTMIEIPDIPPSGLQMSTVYQLQDKLADEGLTGVSEDPADFDRQVQEHLVRVVPTLGDSPSKTPETTLAPYLAFLVRRYAELEMAGISGENVKRLPLDRIYVRLRFRGRGMAPDVRPHAGAELLELAAVLPHSPLAIIGDPGAGKTTILRYVALRLARHRLNRDPTGAAAVGLADHPPAPVLFTLRHVADDLRALGTKSAEAPPVTIWGQVIEKTLSRGGLTVPAGGGSELLARGGMLLLFDGLDEVSGQRDRERLAEAISVLAVACVGPEACPNRVVVTCRTRAWGEGEAFGAFGDAHVQALDDEGIAAFVEGWCRALRGVPVGEALTGEPAELFRDMGRALTRSRPVRRIATNPQMLTMLAVLFVAANRLPEQRALLYHECVEWLIKRRADGLAAYGGIRAALSHLQAIARGFQEARDAHGQHRDALERDAVIELLRKRTQTDRYEAGELLHGLEVNVGLIVADGARVRFHHRTFQEYLVARAITDSDSPAEMLGEHLLDPQWSEVVALTAGLLAMGGEERLKTFLEAVIGPAVPPRERAPRVGVAARCLEDLVGWGVRTVILEPLRKALDEALPVLSDPKQEIAESVRIEVAAGLGRTIDPRLTDQKRWVTIPAGPFWRGAAPDDDQAYDNEKPAGKVQVSEFWLQRWPVTVGEFARFVHDAQGYADPQWWDQPEGWDWRKQKSITTPDNWADQLDGPTNVPVTEVSWWEARAWCRWYTTVAPELPDGWVVRLPTEAEWEKAARGGLTLANGRRNLSPHRAYPWGKTWNAANAADEALCSVGCFAAGNGPYGAWDQAGSVWEWCLDWFADAYLSAEEVDPAGALSGESRVLRGGGWRSSTRNLRVSCRGYNEPWGRDVRLGLRCVAGPPAIDPWPFPVVYQN